MRNHLRTALAAVAAATSLLAPVATQAAPIEWVFEPAATMRTSSYSIDTLLDHDLLSYTVTAHDRTETTRTGPNGTVNVVEQRSMRLSALEPSATDRDALYLSLFRLISYFHAQQLGEPMRLAETGMEVVLNNAEQVAAVPLPGAAWLFLMGLLGLGGTRLGSRRRAQASLPAGPQAVAAAA